MIPHSLEDILAAETSDRLYDIFDAYCMEHGINNYDEESESCISPDDVLTDYIDTPHENWLRWLIREIERVQDMEEFELACELRGEK